MNDFKTIYRKHSSGRFSYLRAVYLEGEKFYIPSKVKSGLDLSGSVTVIASGSATFMNQYRNPITYKAGRGRIGNGLMFSGGYYVKPHENMDLRCFSLINHDDIEFYELKERQIDKGEWEKLSLIDGFELGVVMMGRVTTSNGMTIAEHRFLEKTENLEIIAEEPTTLGIAVRKQ